SALAAKTCSACPRAASPLAMRRRSASVPPPERLRCMNAMRIARRSGPRPQTQPEGLQTVAEIERAERPRLAPGHAGAARVAGAEPRAGEARVAARLASHERCAAEHRQHLRLGGDELLRDPDRLLAHGRAVARDSAGVPAVPEDGLVDEDRREAG